MGASFFGICLCKPSTVNELKQRKGNVHMVGHSVEGVGNTRKGYLLVVLWLREV